MLPPHDYNPTTCLWERLGFNVILNHHVSERFRLTKLCMVIMLGNMENERTFPTWPSSKQSSKITLLHIWTLLSQYMCRNSMTYKNFPFYLIICDWNEHQLQYGVDA
jgi:hypothetical protein